jgi:hypothetical protein
MAVQRLKGQVSFRTQGNCLVQYHLVQFAPRGWPTGVIVAIGDVAQLGERSVRIAEVEGSSPFISTTFKSERRPLEVAFFI